VICVVKLADAIYVPHAFQKKTQQTRQADIALAAKRYQRMGDRAMTTLSESSGNVFADLGFPPEEAALLRMRAELMARLRETIANRGWTQAEAAIHLGVGQSRVSDLVRGKWDKFSLDMLVTLTARAGHKVELAIL
jgi:predicted XRE-type DNA-binding protein